MDDGILARERLLPRVPHRQPGPDVECALSAGAGAGHCFLRTTPIAHDARAGRTSTRPRPAGATYRIGVGTNWLDDPEQGDVFAFSPPVSSAR